LGCFGVVSALLTLPCRLACAFTVDESINEVQSPNEIINLLVKGVITLPYFYIALLRFIYKVHYCFVAFLSIVVIELDFDLFLF